MTGETITDMTFFTEYYRMADHDIYSYWKSLRPSLTPAEKQQRAERKAAIIAAFEKEYHHFIYLYRIVKISEWISGDINAWHLCGKMISIGSSSGKYGYISRFSCGSINETKSYNYSSGKLIPNHTVFPGFALFHFLQSL